MTDDLNQRLIALECRLAHYETMADEMSDVMAQQGRAIDTLTAQVRHLRERLAENEDNWGRSPQDDKPPPHY
jgi:SlyX protein